MIARSPAALLGLFVLLVCLPSARAAELSSDRMTLRFDPEDAYSVSSLSNHAHDLDFIDERPESAADQNRSPWEIEVRTPTLSGSLTAADAADAAHEVDGDTITIRWTGVQSEQFPGNLTVTATVRLPEDSAKSYWRCEVSGTTTGWLWQVDFPRVLGIREFEDCQMSLPHHWGRLLRKPQRLGRQSSLVYPGPASMQWISYWGVDEDRDPPLAEAEDRNPETGWAPDYSDAAGLYWAAEDGELHMKRFRWNPTLPGNQMALLVENIPGLDSWPMPEFTDPVEVAYSMPYEVAVGVFTGDWLDAARIYREWADQQVWTQRGTVDQWPEEMPAQGSDELMRWTPPWFRDIGFWAKYYHEPAKVLPEWEAARKWLGVPMASHYYRYHISVFNDNDPEHLPGDPYLLEGIRAAREMGVEPMPYILATIWDTDTQSWIRENARAAAVETEAGEILPWFINQEIFAWMCLSQDHWHQKMNEICEKMIWEYGMSGVYLDVLAASAARPCYNPAHGHSVHGGNYWGQGARELMQKLRAHIRQVDPQAAFFSEQIGEHLIDVMDGYLTLDLQRNFTPGGKQVWPILAGVYHEHTINFGSDAHLGLEPDHFANIYGRQLIWGSQPLHSAMAIRVPEEGDPTSEIFREYTRAYYVAGQPWLMGGRMLRMAVRPRDGHVGSSGLELTADAHTVPYDNRRDRLKIWTGPAVMASAWERFGDIGIILANVTGEEQSVDLTVRGDVLGLAGEQMVRLWPETEEMGEAAGERTLTLDPWRVAVLCITGDIAGAVARLNELDEMPWRLEVVQEGPMPDVEGPEDALYASGDGPVAIVPADGGVLATMQRWDDQGRLNAMEGYQAEVTGPRAEGRGLPRRLDEQPFALLRLLPHTAAAPHPGVLVISGDEQHLLAVVPGNTELRFAGTGLAVASDPATGEPARALGEEPTDRITLPDGEIFVVGWARFDADEVDALLQFGAPAVHERLSPWAESLVALQTTAADQRDEALAAASRQFIEVAQSFSDLPGILSPVAPLTGLHARMNALVVARTGERLMLRADDTWLAPEITKSLRAIAHGTTMSAPQLTAIGFWSEGTLNLTQPADAAPSVIDDTFLYDSTVRLDDPWYIERVMPVIASAAIERDGAQFTLTDILRLESNRPYQVKYRPAEAVTMVAGQEAQFELLVRNWSPIDLTLSATGSGPEGWTVMPETSTIEAPALSDVTVQVSISSPPDAERGSGEVRVVTNHGSLEDSGFICIKPVSVLDAVVPLEAEVADWERPSEEQLARIRVASKFAVHATEGEQIEVLIRNVRVTIYEDTLSWRLLSPTVELIDEGNVRVDEEFRLTHLAERSGTYYLEVMPKRGSAYVAFENRAVAEVATADAPVQLFGSDITRWFYVPEGSSSFMLGAQDGGPTETARFVITSPTGRVAFEADGNYNGVELPVEVLAGEDGNIWMMTVEPVQDIAFWLAGDVMPYLSTSPQRLLVAAGE